MDKMMKERMADAIRGFRLPRYAELPNVGLYLEQTTKYINSFLKPLGCLEITASMISNYVKKGIIPKPLKKQYYAEHLAYLFFVVFAKNLMQIEDIGLLFRTGNGDTPIAPAYDRTCAALEDALFCIFGLRDAPVEPSPLDSDEDELLRSMVTSTASVIYLNAYLEQLRPPTEKSGKSEKKK